MDTKTIEIEDFSLETNGLPIWYVALNFVKNNNHDFKITLFLFLKS